MEKVEYPKWKYHAEKEACVVSGEDSERALGRGWFDSPADCIKVEVKARKSAKVAQAAPSDGSATE